jgi:uncharacterized membrane protein
MNRFFLWILALSLAAVGWALVFRGGFVSSKYNFRFDFGEYNVLAGIVLIVLGVICAASDIKRHYRDAD